jgi:hypothetical protein
MQAMAASNTISAQRLALKKYRSKIFKIYPDKTVYKQKTARLLKSKRAAAFPGVT